MINQIFYSQLQSMLAAFKKRKSEFKGGQYIYSLHCRISVLRSFPKIAHNCSSANVSQKIAHKSDCWWWWGLNNAPLSVISNHLPDNNTLYPDCDVRSTEQLPQDPQQIIGTVSQLCKGPEILDSGNSDDDSSGEDVSPFPSWETVSCVGRWTIQDRQPEGPHPLLALV